MSPQQRREAERKDRILAKTERVQTLASLLDWHEKLPHAQQDFMYVKGLRYRLGKARNELRNMTGAQI